MAHPRMRTFGAWWLDRGIFLVACLVAGGAALYASFDALTRLAVFAGWSTTAAPGLPLTVDVIALAAGIRYVRLHPEQIKLRSDAFRGVVWSGVVSVTGNAIVHAGITPGWGIMHRALAVAVSAVPAVALGYVVHLVAAPVVRVPRAHKPKPVPTPAPVRIPAPAPEPEPAPVVVEQPELPAVELETPRPRPVGAPRPGSVMGRGLALVQELEENGKPIPDTEELSMSLGCSRRHAQNVLRKWEEEKAS